MSLEQAIQSTTIAEPRLRTVLGLMYACRLVEERITEVLKPYGLSKEQYNVLRILRGQKGKPANLCTVQERMIHKMSNTTRLVDKLLEKQLASRCTCPSNRRKVEIAITEQGLQLLDKLDPLMNDNNQAITQNFSKEELTLFNELLDKIA